MLSVLPSSYTWQQQQRRRRQQSCSLIAVQFLQEIQWEIVCGRNCIAQPADAAKELLHGSVHAVVGAHLTMCALICCSELCSLRVLQSVAQLRSANAHAPLTFTAYAQPSWSLNLAYCRSTLKSASGAKLASKPCFLLHCCCCCCCCSALSSLLLLLLL
jgi:hypothetical protein